ncbi:Vinexin [Holothuria leucospilota]|uniref:Vinexin n=1 Tax=Holothuria leucospilota TaxID=206669 RepID=A0A9Q1BCR3_HOLLE|nr:Vinexin [Holothuria leucospilota]
MARYTVVLEGGAPWGFRLKGGQGNDPICISKINPRSKAAETGSLEVGDIVESVNNINTKGLDLKAIQGIIYQTKDRLNIVLTKRKKSLPNGGFTMSTGEVIDTRVPTSATPNTSSSTHEISSSDDIIYVDGVTLQGFDPGNVSVIKTTTTRKTKITRSRSRSPVCTQKSSSIGRSRSQGAPRLSGVSVIPGVDTDSDTELQQEKRKMSEPGVWHPRRSRERASDRNRSTQWRPVNYRPGQSKDDTARTAMSPPPVPPPPGDATDTEADDLPAIPPKPQEGSTNVWLSANTPMQGEVYSPSSPRSPIWQNGKPDDLLMDLTNQNYLGSKGAALFAKKKNYYDALDKRAESGIIAPPPLDIMNNNKPVVDPWDDWLPPPPPDWQLKLPPPSQENEITNGRNTPPGVWQPGQPPEQNDDVNHKDDFDELQPVWVPSSTPPPKKEFRSVKPPQQNQAPPPPLHNPTSQAPPSLSTYQPPPVQRQIQPEVHTAVHHQAPPSPSRKPSPRPAPSGPPQTPPRAPSRRSPPKKPNVTVITDPAQLPEGALYQTITMDGDKIHTDTFYPMEEPKQETTSLSGETKTKIIQKAPTYEGIGPRDRDSGMPLGLRQHVKEDNRHDWYKEMYKSIHKQERDEDGNPMIASYEMKEPETPQPPATEETKPKETVPSRSQPSDVVTSTPVNRYRQQPRSIVDYEPGKSSLVGTDKAPIEPQTVRQEYSAPPPQTRRSGYGSDDEGHRMKQNVPKGDQNPEIGNQGSYYNTKSPYQFKSMSLPRGLPRQRSLRLHSDSGGRRLSAAERLGIKSPPPKRAPSLSSIEGLGTSNISGKDKNYNYKNPPHTLDKAAVQRMIDEEKKKRALADQEIQDRRRHSDFTPTKGPIITDDRFRDLLADAKPLDDKSSKKETRACAIAVYSFAAQSAKELAFNKGDMLYLTRDVDKNWYEGEHHGRTGIFPKSYVEVVTSIDEARKNQLAAPSREGKAKAKFKFKGETQSELSFSKHDYIDLIRRVDANWWEGRIGARTGIFPDSYVEVLKHPEVILPAGLSPTGSNRSGYSPTSKGSHSPTRGAMSPGSVGGPQSPSRLAQSPTRPSAGQQQQAWAGPTSPGRVVDERLTQSRAAPVQSQPSYHQQPRTQQYSPGRPNQSSQPSYKPVPAHHQQQRAPSLQQSPGGSIQTYSVDRQSPTPITRQPQDQYQAMYNYFPQNDDELELRDGDMVVVLEKCDDGWYVGTSMRTGMFGTFPGNYVTKV